MNLTRGSFLIGGMVSLGMASCYLKDTYGLYSENSAYWINQRKLKEQKKIEEKINDSKEEVCNFEDKKVEIKVERHDYFVLDDLVNLPECFASSNPNYELNKEVILKFEIGDRRDIYSGNEIYFFFVWDVSNEDKGRNMRTITDFNVKDKMAESIVAKFSHCARANFSFHGQIRNKRLCEMLELKSKSRRGGFYEIKASSRRMEDYFGVEKDKKEMDCYVYINEGRD